MFARQMGKAASQEQRKNACAIIPKKIQPVLVEQERGDGEVECDGKASSSPSDATEQANKRPYRLAILLVVALVATVIVTTVTAVLLPQKKAAGTTSSPCPAVTVNVTQLPFVGGDAAIEKRTVSWFHTNTVEWFGLDEECLACYTKEYHLIYGTSMIYLICTDGTSMIFGVYDNTTEKASAMGMSKVCIQGSLDLSSLDPPPTRGKDIILSDIADGFNVSTDYLKEEFMLACEVTGATNGSGTIGRS